MALCNTVVLAGCSTTKEENKRKSLGFKEEELLVSKRPDYKAKETESDLILFAANKEMIKAELKAAMIEIRQPAKIDVSDIELSEIPVLDIKNLYYEILSEVPELKYAYDVSPLFNDSVLTCSISYMPYKTGQFPKGFNGFEISTIKELIDAAQINIGTQPTSIRIMDQSMDPDFMNYALQQAGKGYIVCTLNEDATQIVYHAPIGYSIEESLSAINEADQIADEIISKLINETMGAKEKAEVLFSAVSENVKYDERYNTDRNSMPYESQTALGALKDGTAICGGYSHAVKLLFEKVGIPCLNVTGVWFGGNHMWNIAYIDGEWLWCDATADRGNSIKYGLNHFALNELDPFQYQWNSEQIEKLLD